MKSVGLTPLSYAASYYSCLNQQLNGFLQSGVDRPDLSKLSSEEQSLIERACSLSKSSGPVSYYNCMNEQVKRLKEISTKAR